MIVANLIAGAIAFRKGEPRSSNSYAADSQKGIEWNVGWRMALAAFNAGADFRATGNASVTNFNPFQWMAYPTKGTAKELERELHECFVHGANHGHAPAGKWGWDSEALKQKHAA